MEEQAIVTRAEISETKDQNLFLRLLTREFGKVTIILPREKMNVFLLGVPACEMIGSKLIKDGNKVSFDKVLWVQL
jgi:hypothetical protein